MYGKKKECIWIYMEKERMIYMGCNSVWRECFPCKKAECSNPTITIISGIKIITAKLSLSSQSN